MFVATASRPLATTITGSLPRPAWYSQNLGSRPFLSAFNGDAAYFANNTSTQSGHRSPIRPAPAWTSYLMEKCASTPISVGGLVWLPVRSHGRSSGECHFAT